MKYATRTNPPPTMLAMEYVGAVCGGRSQSVSVRFLASGKIRRKAEDGLLAWGYVFFFSHWRNINREEGGKGRKKKFHTQLLSKSTCRSSTFLNSRRGSGIGTTSSDVDISRCSP